MEEKESLFIAEKKAKYLFYTIKQNGLIRSGISEDELGNEIYNLAYKMFGIKKYWHKRIVRSGKNTLYPYKENPKNRIIKKDDILFLDFGPIFDNWEADVGRTFVLGDDPYKLKLLSDVEECWKISNNYFLTRENITASDLYRYVKKLATERSWSFGNEHCGHLIGQFPHEKIDGARVNSYLHPNNHLNLKNIKKNNLFWILEIHFVDYEKKIGGFYEQLLSI
jgi:Xaa-Pro aminopeptidase